MIGFLKLKEFQVVTHTEEDKVIFASYMMRGPTTTWWVGAATHKGTLGTPKDWEQFKAEFLDKYFLISLRSHKEFEFQQLRKGDMSVVEYAKKFEDIDAYSK